ncbi:MAG TPA: hypothetical protein VIA80_16775 [Hyphomonadaceae bacterium]|jgi:hypothetical protein
MRKRVGARRDGAIIFEEFEEGDPRRGPHSPEERAKAAAMIDAPKRWHQRSPDIDWFAVRLQFGRGLKLRLVARMFGIPQSTTAEHRREDKWIPLMTERDRRTLSRLVWLAGIARGVGKTRKGRAMLRAWSDWSVLERKPTATFEPQDPLGAPQPVAFNPEEFPDDAYYTEADPKCEDRFAMRTRLDELIARMERDVAEEAARENCETVEGMAGDEGRPAESATGREGVVSVGAAEPASA